MRLKARHQWFRQDPDQQEGIRRMSSSGGTDSEQAKENPTKPELAEEAMPSSADVSVGR